MSLVSTWMGDRLGTKVTLTFSFFLFLTGVFVLKVAARAPKVLHTAKATSPLITEVKQH